MSQSNLEEIKSHPQSIATSTSQLKSVNNIESEVKESSIKSSKSSKENCIDEPECKTEKEVETLKVEKSELRPSININAEQVWTLKNVANITTDKGVSKKSMSSKQSIPQKL